MTTQAEKGWEKIHWVQAHMPLHTAIKERFVRELPFTGHRIGAALHLEAKTANLMLTLHAGGAQLHVIGSNPYSTQDEIVAALAGVDRIVVDACYGESAQEHAEKIDRLLQFSPTLIVEDGGEVIERVTDSGSLGAPDLLGICEETTTGVECLQRLTSEGNLSVPAIAVNDAQMKHLFDNRYGTGQSVWEAIMHATNLSIAGRPLSSSATAGAAKGLPCAPMGLGRACLWSRSTRSRRWRP